MTFLTILRFVALAVMLSAAVFMDLRERRIPNLVTVPGLLIGVFLTGLWNLELLPSVIVGPLVALLLSFPLVALGGLGAGDAKLFAAVGGFVGVGGLLPVMVFGGIAGGFLALGSAIRRGAVLGLMINTKNLLLYHLSLGRLGERIRLDSPGAHSVPYGLAIAAGALGAWFFPFSLGGTF